MITLEAATLTKKKVHGRPEGSSAIFHSSMIELGLLGLLILVLVVFHYTSVSLRSRIERLGRTLKLTLLPPGCVSMPLLTAQSDDSVQMVRNPSLTTLVEAWPVI